MQRLALPATVAALAGLVVAPVASAATLDELYQPYFDPTPRLVHAVPGDGVSTNAEYTLQGAPEGTTWKLDGQNTELWKIQLEKRGDVLSARLNHYGNEPVAAGENTVPGRARVTYPDTSWEYIDAAPVLVPDDAFLYDLLYDTVTADPGETATLTPHNNFELPLPDDAQWSFTRTPAFGATLDAHTGAITVAVPKSSYDGASFDVKVTFADGTSRNAVAFLKNSGKGVVAPSTTTTTSPKPSGSQPGGSPTATAKPVPSKPVPSTSNAPAGSSPLQKAALVVGILAVVAGIAAFAMPYVQQFLP
mgnify:FL=1